MRNKIVAGNWKMNLTKHEVLELVSELNGLNIPDDVKVMVFPSQTMIGTAADCIHDRIRVGAQNFSESRSGAYTGESSISQIRSLNAGISLIGHSERRTLFNEDDSVLKSKVDLAEEMGMHYIFCCGEPLDVREKGEELNFVRNQLESSLFHLDGERIKEAIIAYEPIWAIGTGVTASTQEAESMHRNIRSWINDKFGKEVAESVTILYGGSCNASNASELFRQENVDGGLIGGASLKADSFQSIINSFE
jgi:triosephosphate isomerase